MKSVIIVLCSIFCIWGIAACLDMDNASSSTTQDNVSSQDCASLDENSCLNHEKCRTVDGIKFSVENQCRFQPEFVMCIPSGLGCDGAIAYAKDLNQEFWFFTDLCVPENWEVSYSPPPALAQDVADLSLCQQ